MCHVCCLWWHWRSSRHCWQYHCHWVHHSRRYPFYNLDCRACRHQMHDGDKRLYKQQGNANDYFCWNYDLRFELNSAMHLIF